MTGIGLVFLTTFLASAVEAIEMVTIVVSVGATRGWRSTLAGAAAGFVILALTVVVLGAALSAIPIGPLRVLVGALLLLFGLRWFRRELSAWQTTASQVIEGMSRTTKVLPVRASTGPRSCSRSRA